jgi:sugar-specific transcriptional regulator TrmB
MPEEKKEVEVITFDITFTQAEVSEIVSMLMEFPAGRVYNILKKLEAQTTRQKKEGV